MFVFFLNLLYNIYLLQHIKIWVLISIHLWTKELTFLLYYYMINLCPCDSNFAEENKLILL